MPQETCPFFNKKILPVVHCTIFSNGKSIHSCFDLEVGIELGLVLENTVTYVLFERHLRDQL